MFVHFGGKKWASLREAVGILTLDAIRSSPVNQEYLKHINRGKDRDLNGVSSMIILEDEGVFYSPICSLTLTKRIQELEKRIASTTVGWSDHET